MTVIPAARLESCDLHLLGNNVGPAIRRARRNSVPRPCTFRGQHLAAACRSLAVHEDDCDSCEPLDTTGFTLPDFDAAVPR